MELPSPAAPSEPYSGSLAEPDAVVLPSKESNDVSIEEYFTPQEYANLPEYEKQRFRNLKSNFTVLSSMG